jgi:hypothetical protein
MTLFRLAAVCAALGMLSGCATIIGQPTQTVPIDSDPGAATVLITNEKGLQVHKATTPTSVTLQKSDGSYWGGMDYSVEISLEGYETQVIPIKASPNGWYLGGNLIFGGLIGWFIVDPLNGDMYTLSPGSIKGSLAARTTHNNRATDGSIRVVLLKDVPDDLRAHLIAVK